MCISDNSCSISTEFGNLNSQQLSCSYFPLSLGNYPWNFTPLETNMSTPGVVNADSIVLDPYIPSLEIGMVGFSTGASPSEFVITSLNEPDAEIDVAPLITIGPGVPISFTKTQGRVSCSIFKLSESVQTKDRENACVDFLQFFVSSGSNAPHQQPTTHIFTDDGFDFSVTPQQELLVWQGGWTTQNTFIEADQLSIGTPLVSWANDIYQYVQITSMSYDANNSVGVNWMTTGTNSYQLENGIVVRGFIDDYCSCSPSASINDVPCDSTASYCVSESLELRFSGSESGGSDDGQGGGTFKNWSVVVNEGNVVADSTLANNNQELTMSISHLSQSANLTICYTESRHLGPISSTPYEFDQGQFYVGSLTSQSVEVSGGYIASASSLPEVGILLDAVLGTGAIEQTYTPFVATHQESDPSSVTYTHFHYFIYCTGSHANLPGVNEGFTSQSYYLYGVNTHIHLFASDSADDGQLHQEHPSYSNAGYSLAWKINSLWTASADITDPNPFVTPANGGANRFGYNFGTFGHSTTWRNNNAFSGMHSWPSASYAYRPTNITPANGVEPISIANDFDSTYYGDTIFLISPQTGSRCASHNDPSHRNLTWASTGSFFYTGSYPHLTWGGAVCSDTDYGIVASDDCCFNLRLNRKPFADFGDTICQKNAGSAINLTEELPILNADTIIYTLASGAIGTFLFEDTRSLLILDPSTFSKGKVTVCYTASSNNPDCTNDADETYETGATSTPDCCPAISGCATIFLHPGFSAGKDAISCYPTMSMTGIQPTFTFTDTVVSQPTWSLKGAILQFDNYELNPIFGNDANEIWQDLSGATAGVQPFANTSANSNATNSYSTEIHMNPEADEDLNFGWFTMSLNVSNGPCNFSDTAIYYVARTFPHAYNPHVGQFRTDCHNPEEGNIINGTLDPETGFIQLQATGSPGLWSYVDPNPPIGAHPNIVDFNNPTTGIRLGICEGPATVRWTQNSSSTVKIGNEDYAIQCEASQDVTVEKISATNRINLKGHRLLYSPSDPTAFKAFTSSVSYSRGEVGDHNDAITVGGPLTIHGTNFGASTTDTVKCMHIFNSLNLVHSASIHYSVDNQMSQEELVINLSPPFLPDAPDGTRMFQWRDGVGASINNVALASSESNQGLMSQSRLFIPGTIGGHNPSFPINTSSFFYFSASTSHSYASDGYSPDIFYQMHISGAADDCNCRNFGSQARLYFHNDIEKLEFATIPGVNNSITANSGVGALSSVVATGVTQLELEPSLGINVPTYKNVEAIGFFSESVNRLSSFPGFVTMSSVITTTNNPPAPFLTASWKFGATIPINPARSRAIQNMIYNPTWKSYNPLGDSGPSGGGTFPNNLDHSNINSLRPEPGTGLSNAGIGLSFEWNAVELFHYRNGSTANFTDAPVITGSFADTRTSQSFFENPTYFPANRLNANQVAGYDNIFASNQTYGPHVINYANAANANQNSVTTSSVMFEVTGTIKNCNGDAIKTYYASQSVMFYRG